MTREATDEEVLAYLLDPRSADDPDWIAWAGDVQVKSQGDYGIIDVRFTTRMGYDSGWLVKNPATSGVVTRTAQAPDGAACAGVVGRKWAKHGLMDLQLAYY